MTTKTHIPGKDSALEDTIANARKLLREQGFPIELVSSKHPVQNCWSVHLRSTECPQIYTNGKGRSELASEASAVLEFFERLSTNLFFYDYYLGSNIAKKDFVFFPNEKWFPIEAPSTVPTHHPDGTQLLTAALHSFYNSDRELIPAQLLDNNTDHPDRGIAALPFEQISSKKIVYFPVSILTNLYVSNGMAAGNTRTECRAQAMAEILERYVKNNVIAMGLCLPTVPPEILARYPRIQNDIEELRANGFPILVKDASMGGQFPVICVLLINPENGGCYASFGASCRFEVALERTVTELLQGRGLDQLDVFKRPSHDLDTVADELNLESHFIDSDGLLSWKMFGDQSDFEFNDWNFEGSTAEEYDHLKTIITQSGHEAYCAEYRHCGIYTCRIIIPGMSDIYLPDDLIWSNKNTGASLRPQLLTLKHMSIDELKKFADNLAELGLNDLQPVSDAIGVLFEEGSVWHTLRIGELKGMLALATGNLEEAEIWCSWCLNFDCLPPAREKLYRVIHTLLNLELSGAAPARYGTALGLFFDELLLSDARAIVAGTTTFHGLTFSDCWENISPAHQTFIDIYQRLHPLKAEQQACD
ncbi:30S ribosomal protein S12 methylthiotransferase accessory factor YcaO [Pontiellaceae bacterium B12219]|nr:30S ribosomal protein S12 methylthiotransferase accessory factor YcaO [Pontiellaceae bacterium B12219]